MTYVNTKTGRALHLRRDDIWTHCGRPIKASNFPNLVRPVVCRMCVSMEEFNRG